MKIWMSRILPKGFFCWYNFSRECNFAMGTILGKGFLQALMHTVHSTGADMAKLDIPPHKGTVKLSVPFISKEVLD